MGPAEFAPGTGIDVRPHPHICLSTVTYLFEGEIRHRDSLGVVQDITPGAINWMTAGRGIVHSERTPPGPRRAGQRMHGIQTWVALPDGQLEREPGFEHIPARNLPTGEEGGASVRVLVGSAYGMTAPAPVFSPIFYVHVEAPAARTGKPARCPMPTGYSERAVYVVDGKVSLGNEAVPPGTMAVIASGAAPTLTLDAGANVMLVGGEPVGQRLIWWNFVAPGQERMEQAKADWREGRFPSIPGETEFIPLPEG
jgi:redox-sensitive bicupin YhaK (pirin superfamily)